jgi:DHA1 family tetracycline resistance protein-like MFS transporter
VVEGELLSRFLDALPYDLTADQHAALDAIRADLAGPVPMHRLLQGEVGSGTTVVAVAALLIAVFLYQVAHDSLPAVWMFYTQLKFDWGPAEMGWSLTFVGVMTVLVMGGLTGAVVPRLGERRSIMIGFLLMTVGFVGYALVPYGWMIYPAIAIGSLGGIANPAMQSVMSRQAGPSSQGELQGAVASLSSIAAILSPLFMTQLFRYYSSPDASVVFPGAPYLVAGALVFACVLIGMKWVPGGESGEGGEKAREPAA